jgi:hypothetical protein
MTGLLHMFPRTLFWRRWKPKLSTPCQRVFFDLVQELSDNTSYINFTQHFQGWFFRQLIS